MCQTLKGELFLIKKNENLLLFTTNENCKYLSESICWLADGTFKACLQIFEQMYVSG